MSLMTTAPLALPSRSQSMSYRSDERPFASPGHHPGTHPHPHHLQHQHQQHQLPPHHQQPPPGIFYAARPASSHSHHGALPSSSHGHPAQSHSYIAEGPGASPERLHSSHGYARSVSTTTPQTPSFVHPDMPHSSSGSTTHAYPPTPMTGPTYPLHQPPEGYYGVTQTPTDAHGHMPSPPGTSDGRGPVQNFTPEGNPIVPVGISGGKMFQCRGFGECDKVFTRSEHLARHVRKHTGERPFPCHCGKAFSRLDNLRQHAATVHADSTPQNEAMLNNLSPVHAALSARASRDQRKRGEIVEVPKNAVERPRHNETFRVKEDSVPLKVTAAVYPPYSEETTPTWDHNTRPRTSGAGYEYPFHAAIDALPPLPTASTTGGMDPGAPAPSRRSGSSASYQVYGNTGHYDHPNPPPVRPLTSDANSSSAESIGPVQYAYRPVSSSGGGDAAPGRNIPLHSQHPQHQHHPQYADSEPPSSAHGPPPQSPLYTAPPPVPQPNWSSPPPPHTGYGGSGSVGSGHGQDHTHRAIYNPTPTPEGYRYPESTSHHTHTPTHSFSHSHAAPPGSAGSAYGYQTQSTPAYYGTSQPYTPTVAPGPPLPPPPLPHAHSQPLPHTHAHAHQPQQHQTGYHGNAYGPTGPNPPVSPFQYHGSTDSVVSISAQSAPPLPAPSIVPLSGEYQYPAPYQQPQALPLPAAGTGQIGLKRRGEDIEDSIPIILGNNQSTRKGPRSSVMMNQPIRALQEPNVPADDDDQLWFPPTTERRSSLAISALLGSPQMDHKPRPPFSDGNGNGTTYTMMTSGGNGVGENGVNMVGGEMEEKAKALLGSAF